MNSFPAAAVVNCCPESSVRPAAVPAKSEHVSPWSRFTSGLQRLGSAVTRSSVVLVLALGAAGAGATTTINQQYLAATINPGDTSHFKITVYNTALVPLTAAKVTVLLVPQVTIAANPAIVNNCGFTVVQAASGSPTLELTGGTIPANDGTVDGQCDFQIDVTATAVGNWVSLIPRNTTPTNAAAGYTAKQAGADVWNTTDASATLSINLLNPPTGAKVFAPSSAYAGDPVTLTITLSNPNTTATMPLTEFTDTLPLNMVVDTIPAASTTCGGTVTADAGTGTIKLTGGSIPAAVSVATPGSCTVTAKVVAPTVNNGTTSQSYNNSLAAGAIGNTRGLTSLAFNKALTITSPIMVTKTFGTPLIASGQPSLMTIQIKNNSVSKPLTITSFVDNLTGTTLSMLGTGSLVPAPANPAVSCSGGGSVDGTLTAPLDAINQTLTLAGATAAAGGTCTITAYMTSIVDGVHTNTIAANAVANPDNHASPGKTADLTANAELTIDKTVSLNEVAPGQYTVFNVAINNWSGGPVTGVSFKDILPSSGGFQMVLDDTGGAIYTADAGCNVAGNWYGTNALGGSTGAAPAVGDAGIMWINGGVTTTVGANPGVCNISIRAKLPGNASTGLTFTNSLPDKASGNAAVTGTGINGAVANTNQATRGIASVASGAVFKVFSPTPIAQGGISTLSVTIYNRTVTPLTNVALTDTLPTGLTLAANPATTNNCYGTLQAFPGDNKLILVGGGVISRPVAQRDSSCTFTAKVTGSVVGNYTNRIEADALTNDQSVGNALVTADLGIDTGIGATKTFTPAAVTSGGTARVKINVTNTSSGQLTNVSVDDSTFSSGLTVANPANAATNCAGSPTLVVNPGAGRAQLQGATLQAGGNCDFSFDVQTSGAGPWSNTIPVGNITSAEGPFNALVVTASLATASASITLNKSFNPPGVTGGVPSWLQIDVGGVSGTTITGAEFTDTFPTGIVVYSVPKASTDCAGGTVTAVPGDGQVSLSGATLPSSGVKCHVYVQTTSEKFLNLTNTIPAGAVSSDQGYTNALLTQASLSTLQGLGVMKSFLPAYIVPNGVSTLKVRLVSTFDANAPTPITLTGVSFTDSLPSGVVVANPAVASTDCPLGAVHADIGSGLVTLTGATITPGTACNITVNVTASALGAYINTIPEKAVSTDQGIPNYSPASDTLYVVAKPTISKVFSLPPGKTAIKIGDSSILTVTINNNYAGAVALSGVALADALPPYLYIASAPAASTTCSNGVVTADPGTGTLALSGASIAAGASCTFQAAVVSNTPGIYTNNIAASTLVSAQGLTNPGPASDHLTVLPPVSVSKVFSSAAISVDGTSTLTITLGNASASDITLTSALVDALPGNVFVKNPENVVKSCPGSVTAVHGATSITYANGSKIPPGGCTISVDVTSALSGRYVNTIAAGQLTTDAGNNPAPAVATLAVDVPQAPSVSKSFSPTSIAAGGTSTLTITLGNPNADTDLTLDALFTDTLPTNLVVSSGPVTSGTCPGHVVAAGQIITYANGAIIPKAGGCTITVVVTSSVGGSYTNAIATGALSTTEGGTNPQPATATLLVTVLKPPTVSKSYSPNTINPGGISRLTITLGNSNAAAIGLSSALTDNLASPTAGVTVAATPGIGGSCVTGDSALNAPTAVTAAALSSSISFASGFKIPPGGCTIQVNVTASEDSNSPYTNTIPIGALVTSAGSNGAPATDRLFVLPPQPPSVSKSFSPGTIIVGGTSTLSISLGNGNAAATSLTADMTDALPTNLVVATVPNIRVSAGCTLGKVVAAAGATSVVYQSGGAIPAGGCTVSVDVTSNTALTSYSNTIAIGALHTGIGNNAVASTASLTVLVPPVVQVTKTVYQGHSNGAGCPGLSALTIVDASHTAKDITWCFAVTNNGGTYLGNPVFTDAGLNISAGASQSAVHLKTGTLPLAPGASATWYVEDTRTTSLRNTVTVGLTSTDVGGVPNGLPGVSGSSVAAAVFAYVFDPPFGIKTGVLQNGASVIRWNMVWINDNVITANNVEIADQVPVGMTYVGNLACTPQGSSVVHSCTFEPASVTYPRGRVRVVADLGADLGATDAASAANELQIAFDASINNVGQSQTFQNQGTASWNPGAPGDPPLTATTSAPGGVGGSPTIVPFVSGLGIPTLSEWGAILLSGLLALFGWMRLRRRTIR